MPEWTARGHHDRHRRRRDPDPNEWLARFGMEPPAAEAPRVVHHNWRQNFAPADFLPITYNLERPWVLAHMNMMEQRGRSAPLPAPAPAPQSAVAVAIQQAPAPPPPPANPIQIHVYEQPQAAAGPRTLTMEEFLRLYPHVGVRAVVTQPVPTQPAPIQVEHRIHYTSPVIALPHSNLPKTEVSRRTIYHIPEQR